MKKYMADGKPFYSFEYFPPKVRLDTARRVVASQPAASAQGGRRGLALTVSLCLPPMCARSSPV